MKTQLLIMFIILSFSGYSQKWNSKPTTLNVEQPVVKKSTFSSAFELTKVDSVLKTKEQIYSITKMFIGQTWGNATTEKNKGQLAILILNGINGTAVNRYTGKTVAEPVKTISGESHLIQNDDKDNGEILVKGEKEFNVNFMMNYNVYTYSYNILFLIKDNKYKMIINNIHCISAKRAGYDSQLIEPCEENDCEQERPMQTGLSTNKLIELMASLKSHLQQIQDNYIKAMSTELKSDNW